MEVRDAIVVLGARLARGDAMTAVLAERVAEAAALWRAGGAPRVVATGGITGAATRAEADVIADALAAAGVPDVLVERASRRTAENARFTAALVAPLGVRAVWLVTQPFHARRAVFLFQRAGLDARAWPIPDSVEYRDPWRRARWRARECLAWGAVALDVVRRR